MYFIFILISESSINIKTPFYGNTMDIFNAASQKLASNVTEIASGLPKTANNLVSKTFAAGPASIGDTSSEYGFSKYDIANHVYPSDLLDPRTLSSKNYVMFFINVSVDSAILKDPTRSATVEGVERNQRGALVGQKIDQKAAIATGAAGGALTGAGTGLVGNLIGGKKNLSSLATTAVGAAVGATAVGSIAAQVNHSSNADAGPGETKEASFSRPQKRLKTAIALYVPNQLSISYAIEWGTTDTAAFAAGAQAYKEVSNMVQKKDSKVGGLAADVTGALALAKGPGGNTLSVASGLAANPKKEQQFNGVEFRTFTFDYSFAPRDSAEAANVLNIIKQFKYHMHPEFKRDSGFLYIYPSEFDITYYNGASENLNLHKHTSCVLINMSVNYSPNGQFVTFPDGMPTQINISLQFKELLALSKETIDKNA